jgi:phosphinothricin acetyltransferase
MVIRDAEAADFEAIAAITNHYILNTPIHFAYEAQTAAELRDPWLKNRQTYPFLVIVHPTGEVVGYAKAARWRERSAYDRTAEVGLYLHPQHCGQGHGRKLYQALIDRCREHTFHSVIGGIALPNAPSVRLHEGLGFRHVGTFHQVGWKYEKWHDVGFWQLMLE